MNSQLVCIGAIRARSVNASETTFLSTLLDLRRDTVRSKNNGAFLDLFKNGSPVGTVQGNNAHAGQFVDSMTIMDNLSNNMNRARQCWVLSSFPSHSESVNDTIAIASRRYFNYFHLAFFRNTLSHLHISHFGKRSHLKCTIGIKRLASQFLIECGGDPPVYRGKLQATGQLPPRQRKMVPS